MTSPSFHVLGAKFFLSTLRLQTFFQQDVTKDDFCERLLLRGSDYDEVLELIGDYETSVRHKEHPAVSYDVIML